MLGKRLAGDARYASRAQVSLVLDSTSQTLLLRCFPVDARLSTLVAIQESAFMHGSVVLQTLRESTRPILSRLSLSCALVLVRHVVWKKCLRRHTGRNLRSKRLVDDCVVR